MIRGLAAAIIAGAILSASPRVYAEPQDRKAAAEALYEYGRRLVEGGYFAEACPQFAESLRLDPGIGTMLWLADCYENTGRTASAWALFRETAAVAARERDTRDKVARRRAGELEPRLTRLVIVISREAQVAGLEIVRDGLRVQPTDIGVPIPVDPGIHTLAATASGRKPWSSTIDIAARAGAISVNVPWLAAEEVTRAERANGPPSPSGRSPVAVSGLVTAGVGLLAIGTGLFLGLAAQSKYDSSNDGGHCIADRCDAIGTEMRGSAYGLASASTIIVGSGAVALLTGGILWFAAPRNASF
jgi:serine/threonine-protein kinase